MTPTYTAIIRPQGGSTLNGNSASSQIEHYNKTLFLEKILNGYCTERRRWPSNRELFSSTWMNALNRLKSSTDHSRTIRFLWHGGVPSHHQHSFNRRMLSLWLFIACICRKLLSTNTFFNSHVFLTCGRFQPHAVEEFLNSRNLSSNRALVCTHWTRE